MDKKVYTVAEAATTLGVGKTTLYELINAGLIATYPLGERKTLIPAQALDDFVDFFYRGGGYEVCDD